MSEKVRVYPKPSLTWEPFTIATLPNQDRFYVIIMVPNDAMALATHPSHQ